jgi:hypothetical protein
LIRDLCSLIGSRAYAEELRADSYEEFCSKIVGAFHEGDEFQLWIELLQEDFGIEDESIKRLHQETSELIAIFATIANRIKRSAFPNSMFQFSELPLFSFLGFQDSSYV